MYHWLSYIIIYYCFFVIYSQVVSYFISFYHIWSCFFHALPCFSYVKYKLSSLIFIWSFITIYCQSHTWSYIVIIIHRHTLSCIIIYLYGNLQLQSPALHVWKALHMFVRMLMEHVCRYSIAYLSIICGAFYNCIRFHSNAALAHREL